MADKKFNLVFDASVEVDRAKSAVASLTKSLKDAGDKVSQSTLTNLNKMIQGLSSELNKLEGMTDIQLDSKNAKNVGKSYEKIFQTFQLIKVALGDIQRTAGINPEDFFPKEIASNITKATQAVQKYKKTIETGVKTEEHTKATKDVAEAERKIKNLNNKLEEAERKRQSASSYREQLQETQKKLQAEKTQAEIESKAAEEAKKVIEDKIKSQEKLAELEEKIANKKKKQQEAVNKAAKANEVKNERENMKEAKGRGTDTKIYRDAVASYQDSIAEVKNLQGEIEQLEAEYTQLSQTATVTADEVTAANERASKTATELSNIQKRLNKNQTEIEAQDSKYTAATIDTKTLTSEIQKTESELAQLIQKKEQLKTSFEQSTFNELIQELEKLDIKISGTSPNIKDVESALENMAEKARVDVAEGLEKIGEAAEGLNKPLKETEERVVGFDKLRQASERAAQDMENLKNQVIDFFSLSNTIQIFKNAVRDAFDTVKELDAVMTETAVVTDFSVGDMWDKLPEYTAQANKLGASIKDLYAANTLYYQQGLKSQQAMGVGVETMKMARIADMDAAQATEAMTAALRGFNMEINEISAGRINDVYSELAAITASDTEQIATAMSKTASIAASANMEFETTAALLAQIIETTQEAPETAGTAMKTIIARFTEVKKLISEGMLTGEDSEGEVIDINKIDAALKTVDISLKDFLNGTKGIDDIFLELASKWDDLDLATQRYIATTAAGSRQQSRFIAMMSNYGRTVELVNAANDSAGASQEQFGKTLDGLEAKLQRLKNAWAEFVMGLSNSDFIKNGVDLLTKILETINELTKTSDSASTSILRIITAFAGFKIGQSVLDGFLGSLSEGTIKTGGISRAVATLLPQMSKLRENFKEASSVVDIFNLAIEGAQGGLIGIGEQLSTWTGFISKSFTDVGKLITQFGSSTKGALGFITTALGGATGGFKAFLLGGLKVAVIAGAIWLLVKAFKALKDATPEGQLKKAKEAAEAAGQAAQEAAESYKELKNSIKSLEDKRNIIDSLTYGTQEWKEAVQELNSEVLALIAKYPELANFLNSNNGILTLDTKKEVQNATETITVASILQKYSRDEYKTSVLATKAKITELENQQKVDLREQNFGEFSINLPMTADYSWSEIWQEFAKAAAKGEVEYNKDGTLAIQKWLNRNYSGTRVEGELNQSEVVEWGQRLLEDENLTLGYIDTITTSLNQAAVLSDKEAEFISGLDKDIFRNRYSQLIESEEDEEIAHDKYIEWVESLENVFSKGNEKFLKEILSDEGQSITRATAYRYGEGYGKDFTFKEGALDQIAIDAGFGTLSNFATSLDMSIEDLSNLLSESFKSGTDRLVKYREETVKRMAKYSKKDGTKANLWDENIKTLEILERKFGESFPQALNQTISSLEKAGDTDFATQGFEIFKNAALFNTEAEVENLVSFIDEINWANPIQSAKALNDEIKKGSDLTKAFSQDLINANTSFLSAQSQFEYLMNSSQGAELQEDLDKIIEKNKKITGADIRELTAQYSDLNTILKNTDITANGLAAALQKVQDKELKEHQLTSVVLSSLSAYDTLGNTVQETLEFIENFDPGADENKIADFIKTGYETVSGNIKKGAYGNTQNQSYLDLFFPGWDDGKQGEDRVKQMTQLAQKLGKNKDNMSDFWGDLAKGKDWTGEDISFDNETLEGYGLEVNKTAKGSYDFTGWEGKGLTSEDLVAWIQDAYNTSEAVAKMMLSDFKNYSTDLAAELEANDFTKGMEKAKESLMLDAKGNPIIDQRELNALSALWDKNVEDIKEALGLDEKNALITDFYDKNGILKESKELMKELGKVYGQSEEEYKKQFVKSAYHSRLEEPDMPSKNPLIDSVGLTKSMTGAGLSKAVANQATQQLIDDARAAGAEVVEVSAQLSNGSIETLRVQAGQTFEEAVANAELNLQHKDLANEIVSAFADAEVELTPGEEGLLSITNGIQTAIENADKTVKLDANTDAVKMAIRDINKDIELKASLSETVLTMRGAASGTITIGIANYKKGIINSPTAHDALVSEEGPELVQTEDGAYLTGLNGPEITRINKGDTVYTAEQTKKIMRGSSHRTIPRFVEGYGNASGGKKSDKDKWENPYDKLYNLVRDIEEELKHREKIERAYEKILSSINTNTKELIETSVKQLKQLEKERLLEEERINSRLKQLELYQTENEALKKYGYTTTDERGDLVLRIDWEAINAITDKDEGEKIKTYITQLEEWFDDLETAYDSIEEIEEVVREIYDQGKDEYFDLESQIKDALVEQYQKEIDELSTINNTLNDSNSKIISSIEKAINEQRQARQNQETEDELSNMQRRLLLLQQDTSGANDMEILRLEKEIKEQSQDYTDSLIDQRISQLQEQNDKAAEQRARQISIAQAQLDQYVSSGKIWSEVYSILENGIDSNGVIVDGSSLMSILQSNAEYASMSNLEKLKWGEETRDLIAQAVQWLQVGNSTKALVNRNELNSGQTITFNYNGQKLTGTIDDNGNVAVSGDKVFDSVYRNYNGEYYATSGAKPSSEIKVPEVSEEETPKVENKEEAKVNPYGKPSEAKNSVGPPHTGSKTVIHYAGKSNQGIHQFDEIVVGGETSGSGTAQQIKAIQWALVDMGYDIGPSGIDGKFGTDTQNAVKAFQRDMGIAADGHVGPETRDKFKLRGYKSGGLADFTGPAWLDGTKAHPEYVLNSVQTEGFLKLVDVLSSMRNLSTNSIQAQNIGGDTFDIDINIETVREEADIDLLTEKVQSAIVSAAKYRNNIFVQR